MRTLQQAITFDVQPKKWHMEMSIPSISEAEFEEVFKSHFKALHSYACTILKEETIAEEIVQQVFFKLWERRARLEITQSIKAYLYRSVYNECLNHLKHQKVKQAHKTHTLHTTTDAANSATERLHVKELEAKIGDALNQLPEQCRTIFQMSRFENLKYREIATQLNLSVKTIENQMGKALKIMRMQLIEYLPILLFVVLGIYSIVFG